MYGTGWNATVDATCARSRAPVAGHRGARRSRGRGRLVARQARDRSAGAGGRRVAGVPSIAPRRAAGAGGGVPCAAAPLTRAFADTARELVNPHHSRVNAQGLATYAPAGDDLPVSPLACVPCACRSPEIRRARHLLTPPPCARTPRSGSRCSLSRSSRRRRSAPRAARRRSRPSRHPRRIKSMPPPMRPRTPRATVARPATLVRPMARPTRRASRARRRTTHRGRHRHGNHQSSLQHGRAAPRVLLQHDAHAVALNVVLEPSRHGRDSATAPSPAVHLQGRPFAIARVRQNASDTPAGGYSQQRVAPAGSFAQSAAA